MALVKKKLDFSRWTCEISPIRPLRVDKQPDFFQKRLVLFSPCYYNKGKILKEGRTSC